LEEGGLAEQNGAWDLELLAAVHAQRPELGRTIELLGTTPRVALSLHDLEPFARDFEERINELRDLF